MFKQLRVGFDLDGVCIFFAEAVWEYLTRIGKVTGPCPVVTDWHFYREAAWGSMDDKTFVEHCHNGVDAGVIFQFGEPLEGSREAMRAVRDAGHRVVIVTDRSFGKNDGKSSRAATFNWLNAHGYPFHEVHFTADKTTVGIDTMVDDKLENYDALTKHGVKTFLLNRAWNHDGADHRVRINHISEYPVQVERIANGVRRQADRKVH